MEEVIFKKIILESEHVLLLLLGFIYYTKKYLSKEQIVTIKENTKGNYMKF